MWRAAVHRWLCLALVVLLAVVVLGAAACSKAEPENDESEVPTVTEPETSPEEAEEPPAETQNPTVAINPLTGMETDEELLARRPFLVSVDNHEAARPQSGLSKADLLYELPVEGGITRFLGVFWTQDVDKIGPVRSARHYHIDLVIETQGILAHAGGSPQYYSTVPRYEIPDLDDIKGAATDDVNAFWRDDARKMPHNLYTSTDRLQEVSEARGYLDADFEVRPMYAFRDEGEEPQGKPVEEFTLHVPGYVSYDITYKRNPAGKYLRFSDGKEHRDDLDGQQLRADNVIVQLVHTELIKGDPEGRLNVDLIGSGRALVFTGGRFFEAKWQHETRSGRTQFVTRAGDPVELTPGQTHILIMPTNTEFEGLGDE